MKICLFVKEKRGFSYPTTSCKVAIWMKPLQQNFHMIRFTYQSFFKGEVFLNIDTSILLMICGDQTNLLFPVLRRPLIVYIHLDMHHQLSGMDSLRTWGLWHSLRRSNSEYGKFRFIKYNREIKHRVYGKRQREIQVEKFSKWADKNGFKQFLWIELASIYRFSCSYKEQ